MDNYNIISRKNVRSQNNMNFSNSQINTQTVIPIDHILTRQDNNSYLHPQLNWNRIADYSQILFFIVLALVCVILTV